MKEKTAFLQWSRKNFYLHYLEKQASAFQLNFRFLS